MKNINPLPSFFDRFRERIVRGIPFIWFLLFLALPVLFTLKMSVAKTILATPPFTPLVTLVHDTVHISVQLSNYIFVLSHSGIFYAFWSSIKIAFFTMVLCVLVGYPMAYAMVHSKPKIRNILFLLIILPYWTSFLLRAYAWINILQNNGLINQLLQKLGITHMPINLIYNHFSLYVGLLYGYLPFFILPVFASLMKLDNSLLEAAYDLGCRPVKAFFKIIIPQSKSGILAGALLVFIPAVGEVVIPQILGGLNTTMIGNVIWQEFFTGNNWGVASALAIVMLVLLVGPIVWFQRMQSAKEENK